MVQARDYEQNEPRVFGDSIAGLLIQPDEANGLENQWLERLSRLHPEPDSRDRAKALTQALYPSAGEALTLARARYCEEMLASAVTRGVSQYVIVGAGLDTFALRRADLHYRLRVFEIDYPTTQLFKRSRIQEAGFVEPPNLYFGPADFETDSIASVLSRLPFSPSAPSFFAWPGVTFYLTREAIYETLRSIRSAAAAGSELVFDYLDAAHLLAENRSPHVQSSFTAVQSRGEPIISGFEPTELREELLRLGYELLADFGPSQQQERYFEGRADGFRASEIGRIAHARVV